MKTITCLKLIFLLLFNVLVHFESLAQKEGNNWYFGNKAGITFNTDTASVLLNGQANGDYGNATISDANGNLLFYFGGGFNHILTPNRQVFDRNHQPMPNGSGLFGFDLPSHIIPWPGTQKYFLITYLPSPNRYCYSVIDMALNNGLGDVTAVKNIPIMALNNLAQPNSAPFVIKHRNNRDYWLILPTFTNNAITFNVFSISPAGLNLTPIISAGPQSNFSGGLRASPDGRTLAGNNIFGFDLFNFDPSTGLVTHKYTVGLGRTILVYQYEFSPDGTKLYCKYAKPGQANYMRNFISQFDLTASTPQDIFSSATIVPYIDSTAISTYSITDIKLGPDGRIYINGTAQNVKYISIIHRPNLPGKAAFFELEALNLDPNNTGMHRRGKTFPTTNAGYIYRPGINMQQGCSGDTAYFNLANSANVDSVKWDFGDPASGMANYSTSFTPKHFYASGGNYTVQTIVYYTFSSDTLTQTIFIPATILKPNLGPDTTLCQGDTLRLNAYQADVNYLWQDSINISPEYVVTKPGKYWVQVKNGCGTRSDTIVVHFSKSLETNFGTDTTLCMGQSLLLQLNNPGGIVTWQDGSSQNTYTVTKPGKYTIQVQNACGIWTNSIQVNYHNPVAAEWLPQDTVVCSSDTLQINGTNPEALTYRWQDGSTAPSFIANTSGIYWLEITTPCSTVRDSIRVTFNQKPARHFRDTTICTEYGFTLTAPPALSYRWSTGETSQILAITESGRYKVVLETVPGCFTSDSITIKSERCVVIPNIITANHDGLNDKFEFKGLETGVYELSIFNRWGTLLYQHENYTNQWPDKMISNGTYYYMLRNKFSGRKYKGWVEVIK